MSEKQAQILNVQAHNRWSPYLEKCCLLLSAYESYARAAEDFKVLTGLSSSTIGEIRQSSIYRYHIHDSGRWFVSHDFESYIGCVDVHSHWRSKDTDAKIDP